MNYQISNDFLKVSVCDVGAQLQSISDTEGREWIHQCAANAVFRRGSVSFPFVGKNTIGIYHYNNRAYPAEIDGFLHHMKMSLIHYEQTRLVLFFRADTKTMAVYPFDFSATVEYFLDGNKLGVVYTIENMQSETMYFGLSAHPCLNIAMDNSASCFLKFPNAEKPCVYQLIKGYISGNKVYYPLSTGNMLQLNKNMSNDENVILSDTGGELLLFSPCSSHSVRINYPQMPFLAFRYSLMSASPTVILEPCTSLPSRYGIVDELNLKADLISLAGGEKYINSWDMSFI